MQLVLNDGDWSFEDGVDDDDNDDGMLMAVDDNIDDGVKAWKMYT